MSERKNMYPINKFIFSPTINSYQSYYLIFDFFFHTLIVLSELEVIISSSVSPKIISIMHPLCPLMVLKYDLVVKSQT